MEWWYVSGVLGVPGVSGVLGVSGVWGVWGVLRVPFFSQVFKNKFVNSDGQWLLSFYKIVTHSVTLVPPGQCAAKQPLTKTWRWCQKWSREKGFPSQSPSRWTWTQWISRMWGLILQTTQTQTKQYFNFIHQAIIQSLFSRQLVTEWTSFLYQLVLQWGVV